VPTDLVVQERHGAVLELRLNNPPFNGLTGPLLMAYLAALEEARVDDGVRVVVTTANGPTWCAGGDLTQLDESATEFDLSDMLHQSTGESASLGLVDRQADLLGAGRHVLAIDAFDKPMIAAIDGAAAGGGLGLALLHDLRFASERALFTVAFTRVGLSLEMGLSYLLPRAVGPQAAFDLAATSRRVPAAEAQTLGLVWRVLPADEMVAAALAYAQDLAERPPLGLQITTRLLRRSWDHTLRRQLEIEWPSQVAAFRSPEARAAIARFLRSTGDADPLPGTARVE
jgi:2-(1,2-epoxy-1,2-dihydrophenyl)acetyl-CoA isomerase